MWIINESTDIIWNFEPISESSSIKNEDIQKSGFDGLKVEIDKSGMISSVIEESMKYEKLLNH